VSIIKVFIREVEETDYQSLLPLWHQFAKTAVMDDLINHFERIKDDENYKTFVALYEDRVVGFIASVRYYGVGIENSYMIITGSAVSMSAHNRGVGTKLLQHLERYAKESEVFSIYLNSELNHTEAHAFYEHNGFFKHSFGFGKTLNVSS